jgi:hypothetical protein
VFTSGSRTDQDITIILIGAKDLGVKINRTVIKIPVQNKETLRFCADLICLICVAGRCGVLITADCIKTTLGLVERLVEDVAEVPRNHEGEETFSCGVVRKGKERLIIYLSNFSQIKIPFP